MEIGRAASCLRRKPWKLPFLAEPQEVNALRRLVRLHLELWELPDVIETAQLCVSELVSNVIVHVGPGTPTTLAVSMSEERLRIEVHDPDARALPTVMEAGLDCEGGRGMALVAASADRWGVELLPDRKVTWVELATEHGSVSPQSRPHINRAEGLLGLYGAARSQEAAGVSSFGRLALACAEETAIDIIADLLHWLHAHGRDADDVLDRAQIFFEAELGTHTW
ncbi:ATP-binding protein [Streptomyces griseosporeus]|uniref:ATP-binding protein n=1 Tax=Streptomyces griseosporeus TaxID=1910 RepID=UPI00167CEE93|nr:ATP-binding protein [Streptomyces griseosporeus]